MRQAFFITGFSNWGKTTIIERLFDRAQYRKGSTYRIPNVNFNIEFTVKGQSNDDEGRTWIRNVQEKIDNSPDNGQNFFTALCPSLEDYNSFIDWLTQPPFSIYDRLNIFLIKYKWEHHAELMINNILEVGRQIPNANFIIIDADQNITDTDLRLKAKVSQIREELNNIFN